MVNVNFLSILQNMPIAIDKYSWRLGGWLGSLENGVKVVVVEDYETTKRVSSKKISVAKIDELDFCHSFFSDGKEFDYLKIWASGKIKITQ